MSLFAFLRSTIRAGVRTGLDPTDAARDATSGKLVPNTLAEWSTTMAAAGMSGRNPSYLWRCQETSGNLADSIGAVALAPTNTPGYNAAVAGWSRKAVTWTDATSQKFTNFADVPNLNANSFAVLAYVYTTNVPAANREVLGMGLGTVSQIKATTLQKYRVENASAAGVNGTINYGTGVRPLLFVYARNAATLKLYTDAEIVTAAYVGISGGGVWLGGQTVFAPTGGCLYMAGWIGGAGVEFTDAEARTLLQTLGWTVGF